MDSLKSKKKTDKNTLLAGAFFLLLLSLGVFYIFSVTRPPVTLKVSEKRIGIDTVIKGIFYDNLVFEGTVKPEEYVEFLLREDEYNSKVLARQGQPEIKSDSIALLHKKNDYLPLLRQSVYAFSEKIEGIYNKNDAEYLNTKTRLKAIENLLSDLPGEDIEVILNKTIYIKSVLDSINKDTWQSKEILQKDNELQQIIQKIQYLNGEEVVKWPASEKIAMVNLQKSFMRSKVQKAPFLIASDSFYVEAIVEKTELLRLKTKIEYKVIFPDDTLQATISLIDSSNKNNFGIVNFRFSKPYLEISDLHINPKIELSLEKTDSAILLPRGSFMQHTGGKWVYVVKDNNAVKRDITLGRGNIHYHEVLDGLAVGEKVITSGGYDAFFGAEKFRIVKDESR